MNKKLPDISFIEVFKFTVCLIFGSLLLYVSGATIINLFVYFMSEDYSFFQTLFNLTFLFVGVCMCFIVAIAILSKK